MSLIGSIVGPVLVIGLVIMICEGIVRHLTDTKD